MIIPKSPYTITENAADYLAKIVETVTLLEYGTEFKRNIKLHRENRLMTLDERLAIGVKCGQLWDEGKEEDARELAKTMPMQREALGCGADGER